MLMQVKLQHPIGAVFSIKKKNKNKSIFIGVLPGKDGGKQSPLI
jgi:hypothetical protein